MASDGKCVGSERCLDLRVVKVNNLTVFLYHINLQEKERVTYHTFLTYLTITFIFTKIRLLGFNYHLSDLLSFYELSQFIKHKYGDHHIDT